MSLISKLFGDETYDPFLSLVNKCPVLTTPTDWKETENAHVFVSDLPGLNKEDVRVEVVDDGRVLQISGERETDVDGESDTWLRAERCRGKFQRRFRLPENAKTDDVKANMEDGVLVVTIPKKEVKKPEKRVVEIEGK